MIFGVKKNRNNPEVGESWRGWTGQGFFFFLSGFVRILACLVGDCLCTPYAQREPPLRTIYLPPVVLVRVIIIRI